MSDVPKLVATAPERIWLQVCDDESCRDEEFPENYAHPDVEVTWSAEQHYEGGAEVAYVRADLPLFGPPIPYSPGDELQADMVLAILCLGGCSCAAEIVTRESIKRYDGSVSHYCVPTRRLTR